jgi:hypothetical protein
MASIFWTVSRRYDSLDIAVSDLMESQTFRCAKNCRRTPVFREGRVEAFIRLMMKLR